MSIPNCCLSQEKNNKCIRQDGKEFSLPRRFSKKKCITQEVKGFSMRSSCAPYKFCNKKKSKSNKSNKSNKNKSNRNKSKKNKRQKNSSTQTGGRRKNTKNMNKKKLQVCSLNPKTGYLRNGFCEKDKQDFGKHLVCATMTRDFLEYTKSKGNDLYSVVDVGDKWCLCEDRWQEAFLANHAPPVVKKATHRDIKPHIRKNINSFMKTITNTKNKKTSKKK